MLNWKERIISGIVVIGVGGMMLVTLVCPVSAIKASYGDFSTSDEYFTAETVEMDLKGVFEPQSGMPCENPEQFERWLETYEQTASEETENVSHGETSDSREETSEIREETSYRMEDVSESESEAETQADRESTVFYSVDGITPDPPLQQMLYEALDRHGISYWFEIGLAQCYQESRFDVYAVNRSNQRDMGILQYRKDFWDWSRGDIFSVDAQFELYAEQMARRINSGLSVDECISRHLTSDYTTAVDWQYVSDVRQWLNTMKEVTQ